MILFRQQFAVSSVCMPLVAKIHQGLQTVIVDLIPLSAGIMPERASQIRFAAARCASQQQVLLRFSQFPCLNERIRALSRPLQLRYPSPSFLHCPNNPVILRRLIILFPGNIFSSKETALFFHFHPTRL